MGKPDQTGKKTPGPPGKKPAGRGSATPGALQSDSRERTQTPTSVPQSPIPDSDPVLYRKYKEKLQAKVIYNLITVKRLLDLFFLVILLCLNDILYWSCVMLLSDWSIYLIICL